MKLINIPQKIKQPNGEMINCYASGDEYFNYIHDYYGYIIIQDYKTGYYRYAKLMEGKIVPSEYIVNNANIDNLDVKKTYQGIANIVDIENNKLDLNYKKTLLSDNKQENNIENFPRQGKINNIVIFIRFKDDSEFDSDVSLYNNLFNNSDEQYISVYNYFKEISYGKALVSSSLYPKSIDKVISYKDIYTRGYYEQKSFNNEDGYKDDMGEEKELREEALVERAIESLKSIIESDFINMDLDNDNKIDNICFIIKGDPVSGGTNTLLWPHKRNLNKEVYINNLRVYSYNLILENSLDVSSICHEMLHSFSFPDLYHYNFTKPEPIGIWDIMGQPLSTPQQCNAYTKFKYGGWIKSISVISEEGNYSIYPINYMADNVNSTTEIKSNNVYKIITPKSVEEYFIVEYRKNDNKLEFKLPGSGLIVYKVYQYKLAENIIRPKGNAYGPPDEILVNRKLNRDITEAYLSKESGRQRIGYSECPLLLNNGEDSGIRINNISEAGDTMSFNVEYSLDSQITGSEISIEQSQQPKYIYIGDTIVYNLTIKNNGPLKAYGISVEDMISSKVEGLNYKTSKGNCYNKFNRIICDIGEMESGEIVTIEIEVILKELGVIKNLAKVTCDSYDPDLNNNIYITQSIAIDKLSTGPIYNKMGNCRVYILIQNNSSEDINIDVDVQNLDIYEKNLEKKNVIVKGNNTEKLLVKGCELSDVYEIIFDKIQEDIYISVYLDDRYNIIKHKELLIKR